MDDNARTHVLISPLGRSPGAVSGLYYALRERQEKPVPLVRVITVGTSDRWVLAAARILHELFDFEQQQGQPVTYRAKHITAPDLRGGEADIGPFVAQIGRFIQQERQAGNVVHVGVTGGRSGMGALTALATQLYGASRLYHLWVDEKIEKRGQMGPDLNSMDARPSNSLLNPPTDQCELVELPFFDLSPLNTVIRRYLKTGELPNVDSPLYPLFVSYGIERLRQVFPAPLTIAQADRLLELGAISAKLDARLESAETLKTSDPTSYLKIRQKVDAVKAEALVEVGRILQDAEIADAATAKQVTELVKRGGQWAGLLSIATIAKDETGLWNWIKKNKDQLTLVFAAHGVLAADITILLKIIEMWLAA